MPTRSTVSERLDQLRAELTDVRAHIERERPEPHSLADRLQEATSHFEETHPRLTLAIGAVAEALSRLGI